MYIITYDFQKNSVRSKFSKFLKKFGRRIQYSVFEIKNSNRILRNIEVEIDGRFEKHFTYNDSIVILYLCEACKKKVRRYGHASHEESELVIFD